MGLGGDTSHFPFFLFLSFGIGPSILCWSCHPVLHITCLVSQVQAGEELFLRISHISQLMIADLDDISMRSGTLDFRVDAEIN